MLTKQELKKLVAAFVVGAFSFSLPMTADAKRIHDPKVTTKKEVRKSSKKNNTVNVERETPKNISSTLSPSEEFKAMKYQPPAVVEQFQSFYIPQTVSEMDTSISGTPMATQEQCVKYLLNNNPYPNLPVPAEEIVSYYYEEGAREGIRPDVAFAQALKETGFFSYGGDVIPEQNNYCGLGTTGGGVKGEFFATPQMGVRAHIQHLLAYSSTRRPLTPIIDPRYDIVRQAYGTRTLGEWQDLNGRWAVPGRYYGQEILSMFKSILMQ